MFLGMILSFKIFSKGIVDHNRIIDVGKINQNHLLPRNMRTFFDFFTLLKPTEKRSWAGFELAFGNTGPPLYIPFSGGNLHLFTILLFNKPWEATLKVKKNELENCFVVVFKLLPLYKLIFLRWNENIGQLQLVYVRSNPYLLLIVNIL